MFTNKWQMLLRWSPWSWMTSPYSEWLTTVPLQANSWNQQNKEANKGDEINTTFHTFRQSRLEKMAISLQANKETKKYRSNTLLGSEEHCSLSQHLLALNNWKHNTLIIWTKFSMVCHCSPFIVYLPGSLVWRLLHGATMYLKSMVFKLFCSVNTTPPPPHLQMLWAGHGERVYGEETSSSLLEICTWLRIKWCNILQLSKYFMMFKIFPKKSAISFFFLIDFYRSNCFGGPRKECYPQFRYQGVKCSKWHHNFILPFCRLSQFSAYHSRQKYLEQ